MWILRTTLILFIFLQLILACKSDTKSSTAKGAASGKKIEYPGVNPDQLTRLRQECTSIDIISLKKEVNVSMSFDNQQAVAIILSFVTEEKANLTNMCLPEAHLVCQRNGEVFQEMDLYYQSGCNALVFMDKDNKPVAANQISNEGVDFFNNFLKAKSSQDTMGRK